MSFDLLGTVNKIRRKGNRGYDSLSPVYELIVNAINAEKNNENSDKNIFIDIELKTESISDEKEFINYLKIVDHGIGFNEKQLKSFKTINSTTNQNLGCRGMGKFEILRSFHEIKITSFNGDEYFSFNLSESNYNHDEEGFSKAFQTPSTNKKTIVECFYDLSKKNDKFDDPIQIKAIELEEIKTKIESKLLLKLALLKKDGYSLNITLQNEPFITNNEIIDLAGCDEIVSVDGISESFTIYHLCTDKISSKTNEKKNYVAYVADNIEVEKDASFFKDKPSQLFNEANKRYIGIVESEYLNKYVSDDRSEFYVDKDKFESIAKACNKAAEKNLSEQLKSYYVDRNSKRENVIKKYPFLKDVDFEYNPDDSEEKMAENGYVKSVKTEFDNFNKFQKKIEEFKTVLEESDYKNGVTISNLFAEEERAKAIRDKAHAVADAIPLFRKHILSRTISEEYSTLQQLEECLKQEGAEHYIHDLVFPRFNSVTKERGVDVVLTDKLSEQGAKNAYSQANLWLIDDSFVGYNYEYIASETQLKDFDNQILKTPNIKDKYQNKRPDVCVFQPLEEIESGEPVLIAEFKRENSGDKIWNILGQAGDYAMTISEVDSRYTRFVCVCVSSIAEDDHTVLTRGEYEYATIKKREHYFKTKTSRNSNNDIVSITYEVMSVQRFAELARKRKEKYMKDLGLVS